MWEITGHTCIYTILADPIYHVKTPQVMNKYLRVINADCVLFPWHVKPENLEKTVTAINAMKNMGGIVVTVPHKTAMLSYCDELTKEAEFIGAVNCIRRETDGRLIGTMIDGVGFTEGLKSAGHTLKDKSVYLSGAGGAASAIAYSLADNGVRHLTVANRTESKSLALIERLKTYFPRISFDTAVNSVGFHDILINGTSLGMAKGDAHPMDFDLIEPHQLLAEVIMEPEITPFLQVGLDRGCAIHKGLPMLQSQVAQMAEFMGALTKKQ